jgi:murein DD-endopeptidase MepM/ murein hydrolase activator NlpD
MNSLSFPNMPVTAVQRGDNQKTEASSESLFGNEFKDMLSGMMGSGMQSSGGLSSSLSQLTSMLTLFPLIERLLSLAMEEEAGPLENTAGAASGQAANLSQAEPEGWPWGGVVTQAFHSGHIGVDFGVVVGTPIQTTMDGKVAYAGWNNEGYGNLVIVENGPYKTYYAHLSEVDVKVGDTIQAGSVVGLSGSTGNSTGPHLHYEVRENGTPIDPTGFANR